MPKAVAPEVVSRIRTLSAEGKSTREIAKLTGVGKSSVARYAATLPPEPMVSSAQEPPAPEVEQPTEMPTNNTLVFNPQTARDFLNDVGISVPPVSLRTDVVPASSPLKGNPKALKLAEALLGEPRTFPAPALRASTQNTIDDLLIVPKAPPPSPEPLADKAHLISQLQMNIENFAPLLRQIIGSNEEAFVASLYTKSASELQTLLKVVERTRLLGNITNQLKHIFWAGCSVVEVGAQMVGLQSQGLSAALRIQETEIQMILKEMAMERADTFATAQRPEVRLAFLVSTALLSVDGLNRARSMRKNTPSSASGSTTLPTSTAPKSPEETFKDL